QLQVNLSSKKTMKKLLILTILLISSCSTKDELSITDENKLFSVTKETAVLVCGGKSRIIESKNEEIIKVEIKDSSSTEKEKFVQFTIVETDRKGGKYRIVNCYPNKDPKKSIVKTITTSYKLN
ncbi:MAG: hypothetical protein ACJZ8C_03815, partial [Prochlorococcus marinus subsp. pastoris]